jgi:hypothetical protein
MAQAPKVRLRLRDVFGSTIRESATIEFHHLELSERKVLKGVDASKTIAVAGLRGSPRGLYRMFVDLPSYMPISQFLNVPASGSRIAEIRLAVNPDRVRDVKFPAYSSLTADLRQLLGRSTAVLNFEAKSGKALYESLDPIRKACLLNIAAKTNVTSLVDASRVLPRIEEIHELRGDRFFVTVAKELREEVKNSAPAGLFNPVSGILHHPPTGFTSAGSFKTPDNYGNLQLSFFMNADDCRADVDLDDEQGLGHVFQVLRNWLTGRPTHPYDIHQILYAHQHIDAGYRFQV